MSLGIWSIPHNNANNTTYTSLIFDSKILKVVRKQKTQRFGVYFTNFKKQACFQLFRRKSKDLEQKNTQNPNNFVGNKTDLVEVIHMNTVNIICAPGIHSERLNVPRKTFEKMNGQVCSWNSFLLSKPGNKVVEYSRNKQFRKQAMHQLCRFLRY